MIPEINWNTNFEYLLSIAQKVVNLSKIALFLFIFKMTALLYCTSTNKTSFEKKKTQTLFFTHIQKKLPL